MKVIFWGTPETAVPFLSCLVREHEVVMAVVQPDKPAGRGMGMSCCPVKRQALPLGIKVLQPEDPSSIIPDIKAACPDICVVAAYGKLLRKDVLSCARLGFINIHFSLLPRYRGAAPVQWALINGETSTGVTSFWLDEGMDTGPVFLQKAVPILPDDDAVVLMERLVREGVELMSRTLRMAEEGDIIRRPQTGESCLAPCIKKSDSWLNFSAVTARELCGRIKGLKCRPRARVKCRVCGGRDVTVQVLKAEVRRRGADQYPAGAIVAVESEKGFLVKCKEDYLLIAEVQPEGKKSMTGLDFLNGFRLKPGDLFAFS